MKTLATTALLACFLTMSQTGCGVGILIYQAHKGCPLPAHIDNFGNLERHSCATDAQWAEAQSDFERGDTL